MTHILFVCLGNICRSPMAEFIMKQWLTEQGQSHLFHIDSAGTSGWHNGEDMHCGTADILDGLNIDSRGFVSSQVRPQDAEKYDYIVAMDANNLQTLQQLLTKDAQHMFVITDLLPELNYPQGVPDPWHTGDFEETKRLLQASCKPLLAHITAQSV
ncbi:low molecular weight protein-tyrosine-phosphatase [Vitreoscilla stercoraria]|uniref:protein-tyrosine-phosphatase n=1 Tax=Vitreoscilla stercoraria TaxID=61 RepID=A0ABY4E8U8_VITST|nr:low molecular weight protein-tyrosine-phosphatase [Vitreoscilla stercoraria]UOO91835.1 low molecular weight phosphotyrosine protein phosphatase [Vitreoscilla stercoraria]